MPRFYAATTYNDAAASTLQPSRAQLNTMKDNIVIFVGTLQKKTRQQIGSEILTVQAFGRDAGADYGHIDTILSELVSGATLKESTGRFRPSSGTL